MNLETKNQSVYFNSVFSHRKGKGFHTPIHDFVNNWAFPCNPADEKDEEYAGSESHLADAIARVAELNGLSNNDVMHIFPLVLRMLKSKSDWAK